MILRLIWRAIPLINPRWYRTSRVLLPQRLQVHLSFIHRVFDHIAGVGFVAGYLRAFNQVEEEDFQSIRIAVGTRRQEELHWLALLGDQHVDLQTVKEASLAGLMATPLIASLQTRAADAVVVTGGHREAVDANSGYFEGN